MWLILALILILSPGCAEYRMIMEKNDSPELDSCMAVIRERDLGNDFKEVFYKDTCSE